ncbi:MAG: methyltransferase domain-containing protein [Candidatus Aegiribacteria sp.]|nr:methyltransferase domain-containing protein [Candidatus Aegiribacteria sp.]
MVFSDHRSEFWERAFEKVDISNISLESQHVQSVIEILRKNKVKEVLDLGCGYGCWSIELAKHGFKVTSADISENAIRLLEALALRNALSIKTYRCTAQDLNLIPNSFDAVVCNSVLDHMTLKETKQAIRNIESMLVDNGIAFLAFDGPEDNDKCKGEIKILEDGSWKYLQGKREGMIWRYYSDQEIKDLCIQMSIFYFSSEANGKRCIWCRKEKPNTYEASLCQGVKQFSDRE